MVRAWKTVSFNLLMASFVAFLALMLTGQTATAANPTTVSFQGKVVNSNGTNVTDGSYGFVFKLYTVSSGGSAVWTESDTVTVTAGVFQVNLGSGCSFFVANACNGSTPIDFSASNSLYLGITFNSDPAGEMTPRVQLQSVPYAYYADNAGSLGGRAASGYVQLSPSGQQTGSINVSSNGTFGGTLSVTGTYNTNTFSSTTLTFGGASANAINGASGQTLTIQSQGSGALTLQSGSGSVSLGTSTSLTNSTGGLTVVAGGTNQTLSLDASGSGKIFIGDTSSGNVEIAGQGTGDILFGGGSGNTGCTVTNSSGALACAAGITAISGGVTATAGNVTATAGNVNATAGTIQTAGTDRITNGGNLTNIGTISAAKSGATTQFNVDASGNVTGAATAVAGVTSTANGGSGLGSASSLTLTSAASFTVGDYVQMNSANCGGTGINPCYAKITAKATNTLTITPALTWTNGSTVNEYIFPEIGGNEVVSPALTTRYGRAWFVAGVATGNGTTYYNEDGISTSLPTYNIAADSASTATTVNIGNSSTTTINIGSSGTTTNIVGSLATSNNGNISAGSGALQGGSLSINSGAFAVNSGGAITASTGIATSGGYVQSGSTANTLSGATTLSAAGTALTVTNTASIGTLSVGSGGLTVGSGNPFQVSAAGNVTAVGATLSGNVTNTLSANAILSYAVTNSNAGTGAVAGYTASNGTTSGGFGVGGIGYTAFPILQNRTFVDGITNALALVTLQANPVIFGVNNAEAARFDTSGNLELGTSAAATARLVVQGAGATSATAALNVTNSTPTSLFYVRNDGNVGIGNTSPTNLLSVGSSSQFQIDSSGAIVASTGIATSGGYIQSGSTANTLTGATTFSASGTALSVTNTASIGTLSVTNGGSFGANVSISTGGLTVSAGGAAITGDIVTTNGNLKIQQAAAGAAVLLNDQSGKAGSLKAGSAKVAFLFDNSGNFGIAGDTNANVLAGNTSGTDFITILGASGNVGIGDTSPSALLSVGASNQLTVTSSGALTTSGLTTLNGGLTVNTATASDISVTSGSSVPTADQLNITNAGSTGVTTAGVNALSVSYKGGAAGVEAAAVRIDLQPGTTTAGIWSGLRVVPNATGAVTGVTENGLKIDSLTTPGAGTENALFVGTGWDNVLKATNSSITQAGLLTAVTVNATTGYQANGTAGITVAACTAGQYIGNSVAVNMGLITAGSCRNDATGLSDERLKTDITLLGPALDTLRNVETNNFYFRCNDPSLASYDLSCDLQTGVIAQRLQQVLPSLVHLDPNDGYYRVDYQGLSVYTLDAVTELAHFVNSAGDATLHDASVSGKVTTPHVTSSGALVIDSGEAANVSIDSGDSDGSVQIGANHAGSVEIAKAGSSTTVKGALVAEGPTDFKGSVTMHFSDSSTSFRIDNSGSLGQINAAIDLSDTSGNGYSKLINSPNFTVTGSGNVAAKGSVTANSFHVVDGTGNNVISLDDNGNASFSGTLNLSSAILGGDLTVGGDVNVAGLSTFQKLATFLAKTVFRQDVEFDGHVTVSKDSAGYAELKTGESTVHVTFTTPYATAPIVNANLTDGQFALVSVSNVTAQGFDISLKDPANADAKLSWTAIGVIDPQTATNPPPVTP
jgi:hypothetical protein